MSKQDLEELIYAFISSGVEYCSRLQLNQSSAARVLTKTKETQHIAPVLTSLYWLPVTYRADFKVLLLETCLISLKNKGLFDLKDIVSWWTLSQNQTG